MDLHDKKTESAKKKLVSDIISSLKDSDGFEAIADLADEINDEAPQSPGNADSMMDGTER